VFVSDKGMKEQPEDILLIAGITFQSIVAAGGPTFSPVQSIVNMNDCHLSHHDTTRHGTVSDPHH